jgi:hypothetical protein
MVLEPARDDSTSPCQVAGTARTLRPELGTVTVGLHPAAAHVVDAGLSTVVVS